MSWLAVDYAIGQKLLGDPDIASQDLDLGGARRGFVVPAFQGYAGKLAVSPSKIGTRYISYNGIRAEIPVYRFNPRGRRVVETWPCLSYELVGFIFNPQRYIWRSDQLQMPVRGFSTEVELHDQKGVRGRPVSQTPRTTLIGKQVVRRRDHPEPFDLIYDVRLWSKNTFEAMSYLRTLFEGLPARGKLDIVQQEGGYTSYDMHLQSVNNIDDDEPTLENSEQRGHAWVFTYVVETHLDNTETSQLKQAITNFELELEQV